MQNKVLFIQAPGLSASGLLHTKTGDPNGKENGDDMGTGFGGIYRGQGLQAVKNPRHTSLGLPVT